MQIRLPRPLRLPLLLLAVNLVVGVLAAGVVYGYAGSQTSLRDQLSAAIRHLNHQRASVAEDLAYLRANRAAFDALVARGLLAGHDRLAAARLLEDLRRRHGVATIHYSFSPQREAPLGPGRDAAITVLATEVTIDMSALTDRELLAFVHAVLGEFPGALRVLELDLDRRQDPEPELLARLRAGEPVTFADGRLRFEWRSFRLPDVESTRS